MKHPLRSATKLVIIPLAVLFWVPVVFLLTGFVRWIN